MIAVYFFAFILFVLLGAVLIGPLLDRQPSTGPAGPADRLATAIEALRELEFDHETGKLDDADYRALRAEYAAEALAARDAGAEVRSEQASSGEAAGRTVCGVCGARVPADARFCSRCGTPVAERPGDRAGGEVE